MTISAKLSASVRVNGVDASGLAPLDYKLSVGDQLNFATGTGNGQASKAYVSSRTLAASTSENLDLSGGLLDPLGAACVFTAIKAIWIETDVTNVNNLVIGGCAANAFVGPFGDATDTLALKPGSQFMLAAPGAGWAVTAATADLLKVLNGGAGTAVRYRIVILGI